MNNPKISVIVPVYNVEKYLRRCVDSILAQTFTDFELLLIDDGSTDKSGEICDEYGRIDGRVRVFHQENGGVCKARQLGIDEAKGMFSIHADPDDWVGETMLSDMYQLAEQQSADMVIADFFRDTVNAKDVLDIQNIKSKKSSDVLNQILDGTLHGSLCNKLIKTSLFSTYHVRFVPNINYCEDALVLCQLLLNELEIAKLDRAYYHYTNDNELSITKDYHIGKYEMRKSYIKALDAILPKQYSVQIRIAAFYVKAEAYNYGIVRIQDLREFYPLPIWRYSQVKSPKSVIVSFILAKFHLNSFVKLLAKRYNHHNPKIDIQ